jgi:hypothetical protein
LHSAAEITENTDEVAIKIGGHKLAQFPSSGSETSFALAVFY